MKTFWKLVAAAALSLSSCSVGGGAGYLLGALRATNQLRMHQAEDKIAKIRPILEDPSFAHIQTDQGCDSRPYLVGAVDEETDLNRLRDELRFAFGDDDARELVAGVEVRTSERGADRGGER